MEIWEPRRAHRDRSRWRIKPLPKKLVGLPLMHVLRELLIRQKEQKFHLVFSESEEAAFAKSGAGLYADCSAESVLSGFIGVFRQSYDAPLVSTCRAPIDPATPLSERTRENTRIAICFKCT